MEYKPLRKQRCDRCYGYWRRHGFERDESHLHDRPHVERICAHCGRKDVPKGSWVQKLCTACRTYMQKHGTPRPLMPAPTKRNQWLALQGRTPQKLSTTRRTWIRATTSNSTEAQRRAWRKKARGDAWSEKKEARYQLNLAVAAGLIGRPSECQRCGSANKRINGHHSDYSKPLEVEWICAQCHSDEHQERKVNAA